MAPSMHLLQQIKANHDAQRPEGLAKNFTLIQDVNANIDKVLQVYVQISEDYRAFMIQRPGEVGNEPGSDDADQPAT
ncbi:hypothetical protein NADE_005760 [Nannochloris sp. 'desiccata']|nr:hypothetical protein KSW81_007668 [Chlorella desiccata (nom. nud.)]KAH7618912.1 hypothetical protein NADE_005760 [Chlorella desiccata (nom. nud.)]